MDFSIETQSAPELPFDISLAARIMLFVEPEHIKSAALTNRTFFRAFNTPQFKKWYKRKFFGLLKGEIRIRNNGTHFLFLDSKNKNIRIPRDGKTGAFWFFNYYEPTDKEKHDIVLGKNQEKITFGKYEGHSSRFEAKDKYEIFCSNINKAIWLKNDEEAKKDFIKTLIMDVNWKIDPTVENDILFGTF